MAGALILKLPDFIYIYAEACNELGEDIDEAYKLQALSLIHI